MKKNRRKRVGGNKEKAEELLKLATKKIECGLNIKFVSIKPGVIKTPLWEKSIENNKENLAKSEKYAEEQSFLIKNAQKNAEKEILK